MRMRILLLTYISVILVAGNSLSAQRLSLDTRIDTNSILLGDQTIIRYIINKENDIRVVFPVLSQNLVEGIEIIGAANVDSVKIDKNKKQISLEYLITAFDTGMYYIPPYPVLVQDDGYTDTMYSKATYLEVHGVAIDTTGKVREIKAPEAAPVSFREILPWILLFILLTITGFLILMYYRKKKRKTPGFQVEKTYEPPYITALRELDKVKAQKLWQQKREKEYYTGITHAIRWYIFRRFKIPALELTSDEILTHLRSKPLNKVDFSVLDDLLNLSDIVKFAKGKPEPDENIRHLDNAYEFIKKTKETHSENITENSTEE